MELEQLKLVLETLRGVGQDAGEIAVLWIWLKFSGGLLNNIASACTIVGVAWVIYRGVLKVNNVADVDYFLREMRDKLRVGSSGYLTDHERVQTVAAIRALVNKHVEETRK